MGIVLRSCEESQVMGGMWCMCEFLKFASRSGGTAPWGILLVRAGLFFGLLVTSDRSWPLAGGGRMGAPAQCCVATSNRLTGSVKMFGSNKALKSKQNEIQIS